MAIAAVVFAVVITYRVFRVGQRSGKQGVIADNLARENTWQTFEFGPVLVRDGQAAELPSRFYVNCHDGYYEPRTAIGQMGPLHYIVIVVDGRRSLPLTWTAAAARRCTSSARSSTCPPAARNAR